MTILEWEIDLKAASAETLKVQKAALATLKEWPKFDEAFRWTGIFHLIPMIDGELADREIAARKVGK